MKSVIQKEKPTDKTYQLTEMIKNLLTLSSQDWGMYAFSREPLEGKFDVTQKRNYIAKAQECGVLEAGLIREHYGSMNLKDIARQLGLTVENPEIPNGGGHIIFAQYTEPDYIEIFIDSVKQAESTFLKENIGGLLENVDIYDMLLAHEMFHGVEYQKRRIIYTKTEKIELWRRPFSNKSNIIALSEIAGMAFAQYIMNISYSPFVFDVILMYAYNHQAAYMLYEDIMQIKNDNDKCSENTHERWKVC